MAQVLYLAPSGKVDLGDMCLEYKLVGEQPSNNKTIVLLHEGLGSVSMWRDFPDILAKVTGCSVLAYSRQGYGASTPRQTPWPLSYMHEEAQDILPRFLDAIGFQDGILVGHSDGGSIAAIHAGSSVHKGVKGIVLIAPHFFTEDEGIAAIEQAKIAYETTDFREKLSKYHGDNVDCAFWGWNGAWLHPDFRKWDLQEFIPKITVPVQGVQGLDDQYGTMKQLSVLSDKLSFEPCIKAIPDCGHSPHKEQCDITVAQINEFVLSLSFATKPKLG